MKTRGAWLKPFQFTAEQRDDLLGVLHRHDEAANGLLDCIQVLVPHFILDYEVFANQVSETPRESRALLRRIARNAKELAEDLETLDALGSASAFDFSLVKLGRTIDSLDYIPSELLLISLAADGGAKLIGPAKRGRPVSRVELDFISNVGFYYNKHLNHRPGHSRGSQFTKFMSLIFTIVDPSNPRSHSDISKFCKKALARSNNPGE